MTEAEAFICQARSDFAMFEILSRKPRAMVPECHPLPYLQMAAEKAAKAVILTVSPRNLVDQGGRRKRIHAPVFSRLPSVLARADVARVLGYEMKRFKAMLKHVRGVMLKIEELHPESEAQRNTEYPWLVARDQTDWQAPAVHDFKMLSALRDDPKTSWVMDLIQRLLERHTELVRLFT